MFHKQRVCTVLFLQIPPSLLHACVCSIHYFSFKCVLCLTNTGFVQCFLFGSHKVCCTLLLLVIFVSLAVHPKQQFCAVFFLWLPQSLLPALVRDVVCVFCLTNTGFVQRYSLGFRKVCCTLAFCFIKFFCVLCLPNIGFVQCLSLQILSSLHAYVLLCIISQACFSRARL